MTRRIGAPAAMRASRLGRANSGVPMNMRLGRPFRMVEDLGKKKSYS
jgi:hypothetical protein